MGKVIQRVREPSTWAALSALFALLGLNPLVVNLAGQLLDVAPTVLQLVSAVGAGGSAAAGIFLPESGGE